MEKETKIQQIYREAEAIVAKVTIRTTNKDALVGQKFNEIINLLEEAHKKYQRANLISPIPEIQISGLRCILFWGKILLKKTKEILAERQKIQGNKIKRKAEENGIITANENIRNAILLFDDALETIESIKDKASKPPIETLQFTSDQLSTVNELQKSALVSLGKSRTLLAKILVDAQADKQRNVKEALYLCKQAETAFQDCLARDGLNYSALRNWGEALNFYSTIYEPFASSLEELTQIITDAGAKLLFSYQLNPNSHANFHSLLHFFLFQAVAKFEAAKASALPLKLHLLGEADQLYKTAFKFSHPAPPKKLLTSYSDFLRFCANFQKDADFAEHLRLVAFEHHSVAQWFMSKNYHLNKPYIRKFGFLTKKGKLVTNWKRRFFILADKSISYYPKPDGKCLGKISYNEISQIAEDSSTVDKEFCFSFVANSRKYFVQADDAVAMTEWVDAMKLLSTGASLPGMFRK